MALAIVGGDFSRLSVRSLLATKGAGCGLGMGGGTTVSTVFGNSMFGGGSGAEVIDVGFAVNGSARSMGEGDEEATAMLY